jgi:HEAT repeat protein
MRTYLILLVSAILAATALAQEPKDGPKDNPKDIPQKRGQELSRGSTFGGKNLDEWIQQLKSKDPSTQENAIATIRLYGPVARDAVPELLKLSRNHDASIRVNVAIALGDIGFDHADEESGIAALVRMLTDEEVIVKWRAASALTRIGPPAHSAIPNLILMLRPGQRSSWELRKAAATALGSVAMDRQVGPDPRAANALAASCGDVSHQVRLESILALIILGTPARPEKVNVQRAAMTCTKDPNKIVSIWAHMLLMRIDRVAETNLAAIAKNLKSQEATVRAHAARALGTVGQEAKSRIPELADALQEEQEAMPLYWICWATVEIGKSDAPPRAVAAVSRLLQHRDPGVRRMAEEALNLLNSKPVPTEPAPKEKK